MSLRDRLESISQDSATVQVIHKREPAAAVEHQEVKTRIHQRLLERLDLAAMESMAPEQLSNEIGILVERLLAEEPLVINDV